MPEAVIREPSAKDLNLAFFVFFPFDFRLKFSAPQIDAAASAIDLLHREVSEKRSISRVLQETQRCGWH
jgi:hypothetical protein